MSKRLMLSLALALLGVGALVSIRWTDGANALAHEDAGCADRSAADPFMDMADPNAPYDLRFIDEMIMHHRGAIMSAEMMITDSEHPELRDLARRIQESQQHQIDQMLAWRAQWYPTAAAPAMSMDPMADTMENMMDGDGMMSGGMMGGEMADRMFLRMMIPHHQLAIDMAEDALVHAEHQELKGLAREIIAGQAAEITEMEGYLRAWYDAETTRDAAGQMRAMMRRMMGQC